MYTVAPEQSSNRVIGNILYCLQLSRLIDPTDRSILVFRAGQQPELLQASDRPYVLEDIHLELTVDMIFSWLKMSGS